MSRIPERWKWPLAALGAVAVIVGATLAIREWRQPAGQSDFERRLEGGEGEAGLISDPVKRLYVERANEVCAEAFAQLNTAADQVFRDQPTHATDAQLREYLGRVLPTLRRMIEELRRVPSKPPGDAGRIDAYYDYAEDVLARLERLRQNPGSERLRRLADSQGGYLKNLDAQNYGLEICAQED